MPERMNVICPQEPESWLFFLHLNPETNGSKVGLLLTEQRWAPNDLVLVFLSHPVPVPSPAASGISSWASFSKKLLWENLILAQLPQGAPSTNLSQATGGRVFYHWAKLQTWLGSGGHWIWSHLCYPGMARSHLDMNQTGGFGWTHRQSQL